MIEKKPGIRFIILENGEKNEIIEIPLAAGRVHAGFTNPTEDFTERRIDLNRELIRHPASTFFAYVDGDCMEGEGLFQDDMLVVDKSIKPVNGCLAVCILEGEFLLRRTKFEKEHAVLLAANDKYEPRIGNADNGFAVWGVVTHVIRKIRNSRD